MERANSQIVDLLRQRAQQVVTLSTQHGFGEALGLDLLITSIEASGIEQDGEEDTRPLKGAWCEVVVECTVTEMVCNLSGNMHGGAVAYVIDLASALPLVCMSGNGRWPTSGVSTNINIYYLAPAPCDSTIRIVSRVVTQGLVVAVIDCKVYDKDSGKLLMTGTHVKQDNVRPAKAWGKL